MDSAAPSIQNILSQFYRTLAGLWGPQHWWPAESPFEVIVGAYLTQNTSWTNVERAMTNLRAVDVMSPDGIRQLPLADLEQLIRPAGYFRQKARRLKIFVEYLDSGYGGSLEQMFQQPTAKLRSELLALNGVGPETADSILLYAGNHPVFVVDAYTRRVLDRHAILPVTAPYDQARLLFEQSLGDVKPRIAPPSSGPDMNAKVTGGTAHQPSAVSLAPRTGTAQTFNEMHALLVRIGKHYCLKSAPKCEACPLGPFLNNAPE
jgi:endonuclease III related protein